MGFPSRPQCFALSEGKLVSLCFPQLKRDLIRLAWGSQFTVLVDLKSIPLATIFSSTPLEFLGSQHEEPCRRLTSLKPVQDVLARPYQHLRGHTQNPRFLHRLPVLPVQGIHQDPDRAYWL